MKLNSEFYRLPLKFDVERLKHEVNSFKESDWLPHPSGYKGNSSIPLISVNGQNNDNFAGPMDLTPSLNKCPYIKQVISSFNEVFGRSRLMRLGPGYEVPEHSDINYHWYSRVRIHIPIITFPEVMFYCGKHNLHMAEGETWIFDAWEMHKVINGADKNRVHLVIDTSGSSRFWDLIEKSDEPHKEIYHPEITPKFLEFDAKAKSNILTEKFNVPLVMMPGEVDSLALSLIHDASLSANNSANELNKYTRCINEFRRNWRASWSMYGPTEQGWPAYKSLIDKASQDMTFIQAVELNSNKSDGRQVFNARILISCLNPTPSKSATKNNSTNTNDEKPGRNSPCPCGSGKKYKRCHGAG